MRKVENFIQRLGKVRGRNGSWTAQCPAHEDKSPSLSVREVEDGRVLVHCFGGCDVHSVLGAVGMNISDLFPPKRDGYTSQPVKPAFYASDLIRIVAAEALIVMIAAYDMAKGKRLSEEDTDRLKVAQQRIEEVVQYAGI